MVTVDDEPGDERQQADRETTETLSAASVAEPDVNDVDDLVTLPGRGGFVRGRRDRLTQAWWVVLRLNRVPGVAPSVA